MQADAGQRRGEQVALAQAPEDRPLHPGEDAGHEEDRGRPVDGPWAAAGDLVKSAAPEAASWKVSVDDVDPERDRALDGAVRSLDSRDLRPQLFQR